MVVEKAGTTYGFPSVPSFPVLPRGAKATLLPAFLISLLPALLPLLLLRLRPALQLLRSSRRKGTMDPAADCGGTPPVPVLKGWSGASEEDSRNAGFWASVEESSPTKRGTMAAANIAVVSVAGDDTGDGGLITTAKVVDVADSGESVRGDTDPNRAGADLVRAGGRGL